MQYQEGPKHTLICKFILLSFGICVCIWKAVKALANKGGLGAWGPGPV